MYFKKLLIMLNMSVLAHFNFVVGTGNMLSTIANITKHFSPRAAISTAAVAYVSTFIPTAVHYGTHLLVDSLFTRELPKGMVLGMCEEENYIIQRPLSIKHPRNFPLPIPFFGFAEYSEKPITKRQEVLVKIAGPTVSALASVGMSHFFARMSNRFLANYFYGIAHYQAIHLLPLAKTPNSWISWIPFSSDGQAIRATKIIPIPVHVAACAALHYFIYRYAA